MTRPTVANLRPIGDPLLTNMLIAYMNDDMDYIARRAAPVVTVNEESGTYPIFDKKYWFSDGLERRAYGDRFARGGYKLSSDTYKTLQWGLEHAIPQEHQATNQIPMNLMDRGMKWLANQSNLRKEIAFATDFMALNVWTTDNTGATDWDSTGTPIADSLTARRTVRQLTGVAPNAIFMGEIVYDAILTNAEFEGASQYTRTLTAAEREALVATVLGFDIVGVSRAMKNTENLGQDASLSPIIDDDALVCHVMPGATMDDVTSLKTFAWGPGGGEGSARSYFEDQTNSDIAQHQEQWDQKLIAADTGYFFSDIV